jgi:hypothetical protein
MKKKRTCHVPISVCHQATGVTVQGIVPTPARSPGGKGRSQHPEGDDVKSPPPSVQALTAQPVQVIQQGINSAIQPTIQVTPAQFALNNTRMIANQAQLTPFNLQQELAKAIPPAGTPIDLQRRSSSPQVTRVESDNLFVTRGIGRVHKLEKDTTGADKLANGLLGLLATASSQWGGAQLQNTNINVREAVERILADRNTPWHVSVGREVTESTRR